MYSSILQTKHLTTWLGRPRLYHFLLKLPPIRLDSSSYHSIDVRLDSIRFDSSTVLFTPELEVHRIIAYNHRSLFAFNSFCVLYILSNEFTLHFNFETLRISNFKEKPSNGRNFCHPPFSLQLALFLRDSIAFGEASRISENFTLILPQQIPMIFAKANKTMTTNAWRWL